MLNANHHWKMGEHYRQNVAGILQNRKGKILVAERVNHPGSWQFPQGGVDSGETLLEAFYREIEEEIGLGMEHYEVMDSKGGYRYTFEDGHSKFGTYFGQEQTYFLCQFLGKKIDIRIDTKHPEFRDVQWIKPKKFQLDYVPPFKQEVYKQVFADFFNVSL